MFLGKGIAMGSKAQISQLDVYSHNMSYSKIWISSLIDGKEKLAVNHLYRIQRSVCLDITGALRASLSIALNTILHFHSIDHYIMAILACSAVRLNGTGC